MENLLNLAHGRKSVRTYNGEQLSDADREKLIAYADTIDNPYDIPVRFVWLDAKEHGLSSPVLAGEQLYVAAKIDKVPHAEEAYGYSFEKLILYAWSLGIGTVWIGGTMNRQLFENACGLGSDERMPCISPFGYPAAKPSVKEKVMRMTIKADHRKPLEEIFFENSLATPLSKQKLEALGDLPEIVRWAPSAVNKQPWRIIEKDGIYHFYEKKSKGYVNEATGDLQRIDVGIAMCHFDLAAKAQGWQTELVVSEPDITVEQGMEYVAGYLI